jgi:hypothetical protein
VNRQNEQTAKERGKSALTKVTTEKDRKHFEKEMKKLQV